MERDSEEHKGLVSVHVHVHVHEPAFMAATIIKKEKRNKILNDIDFLFGSERFFQKKQ